MLRGVTCKQQRCPSTRHSKLTRRLGHRPTATSRKMNRRRKEKRKALALAWNADNSPHSSPLDVKKKKEKERKRATTTTAAVMSECVTGGGGAAAAQAAAARAMGAACTPRTALSRPAGRRARGVPQRRERGVHCWREGREGWGGMMAMACATYCTYCTRSWPREVGPAAPSFVISPALLPSFVAGCVLGVLGMAVARPVQPARSRPA